MPHIFRIELHKLCVYTRQDKFVYGVWRTHTAITTKKSIILKLEKNKRKRQNSISKASSEKIWLFNGNLLFLSALNWNDIHTPKTRFKVIFWLLTERSFKRARAHSLFRRSFAVWLVGWPIRSPSVEHSLTHFTHQKPHKANNENLFWNKLSINHRFLWIVSLHVFVTHFARHYHCLRIFHLIPISSRSIVIFWIFALQYLIIITRISCFWWYRCAHLVILIDYLTRKFFAAHEYGRRLFFCI